MRKACVVKEKACSSGSDANPLLLTSPPPPPHQFTYTPGWSLERHSECPVQKHNKMSLARMQFRPVDWVLNHYGNTALQVSDMVFHNSSCFFFLSLLLREDFQWSGWRLRHWLTESTPPKVTCEFRTLCWRISYQSPNTLSIQTFQSSAWYFNSYKWCMGLLSLVSCFM